MGHHEEDDAEGEDGDDDDDDNNDEQLLESPAADACSAMLSTRAWPEVVPAGT